MNRKLIRKCAAECRRWLEGLPSEEYAAGPERDMLSLGSFVQGIVWSGMEAWGLERDRPPPALVASLPVLLQKSNLAAVKGVLQRLRPISAEDWRSKPEIAGWLYQYFLEERKKNVFAQLRKGAKAGPADLPAVTQLFTPEWIARYMAENALGGLMCDTDPEGHRLPKAWRYLDKSALEERTWPADRLTKDEFPLIRDETNPIPSWSVMDPACGCGHLLSASFDVLAELYQEAGYTSSDAARCILADSLFGLDIDPFAVQIGRFVLLMKAFLLEPAVLHEAIVPMLYTLEEDFGGSGEEIGSLYKPKFFKPAECESLYDPVPRNFIGKPASLLCRQYDVVITNPPYLGRRHMSESLAAYVDAEYPLSRNDLYAAFLERCTELLKPWGYHASITQQSWMFLSGYESLRRKLLKDVSFVSLLHLGSRAFEDITGEVVQTVSFVLKKHHSNPNTSGVYWNLTDFLTPKGKEEAYLKRDSSLRYVLRQQEIVDLPGAKLSYRLTGRHQEIFRELEPLHTCCHVKKGMDTGNNEEYVRYWYEVPPDTLSFRTKELERARWFPYAKGGGFRKWYGNHLFVLNWEQGGRDIRQEKRSNLRNERFYFRPGITWSTVSTAETGFRLLEPGFLFDNGGSCIFPKEDAAPNGFHDALLALLNARLIRELLGQLYPTINVQPGDIGQLPIHPDAAEDRELARLGRSCVRLAKEEWDETELSWNFKRHPLAKEADRSGLLSAAFREWSDQRSARSKLMRELERQNDERVDEWYGISREAEEETAAASDPGESAVSPLDKVNTAVDPAEAARSFLSFAVGCMTSRYSSKLRRTAESAADVERLTAQDEAEADLLLVLAECSPDGMADSLSDGACPAVHRLRRFLALEWGEKNAEANMEWLADALGRMEKETAEARLGLYLQKEFWPDHLRRFARRPYYGVLAVPDGSVKVLVPLLRLTPQLLRLVHERYLSAWMRLREANGQSSNAILRAYAEDWQRVLSLPELFTPSDCCRTRFERLRGLLEAK